MDAIWNIIGYTGSLLILFSFFMVTRAKWQPQQTKYLVASFFGAVFLAIYQIWLGAYAGVLLNIVFAAIAIWALVSKPKISIKTKHKNK